jgi:hypothetical protein
MNKIRKNGFISYGIISLAIFLMLIVPVFSFAQTSTSQGLIPCGRTPGPDVDPATIHSCGFKDIMTLINKLITFILVYMAVPIAAIMFFYAGFKMVTSGGNPESRGTAKNVFTNAVIGLVIAAGAWLIVKTLLVILGYNDIGTFF